MKTKLLLLSSIFLAGTFTAFSQNPNDDCSDAETLTLTTTSQTVNLDLNQAVYNNEQGCDTNDIDDYTNFWYEFTMPANSNLYINVTVNNNAALFDACNGAQFYCFTKNKLLTDLVGGQTYKLRIFRSQTAGSIRNYFHINTYDKIANDDCANAETLPTLTSANTQIQVQLAGASVNQDETCAGIIEDDLADAWYQFTMPITGNLFVDTPNGIAIYDACNGNELYCNASESSLDAFKLIDNLQESNTYLLRLFSTEQHIFEYPFQNIIVRVYERAANDECTNAEVIPAITTASQEISFDTFGSLINFEDSCGGLPQEDFVDVWFEFTMPNTTYLNFESYQFNFFTIYDACNGNEVSCFAGVEQISGLTPNQTYILRVFQRQTEMFHPNKFFNIYGTNTLGTNEFGSQDTTLQMVKNRTLSITNLNVHGTLTLYNLMGQKIVSKNLKPSSKQSVIINVGSQGIYIARLNTIHGAKSLKLVIK